MSDLKPFISFFGGKYRIGKYYRKPFYNTIVEPFAGSAGYSVRYYDFNIFLYDVDPMIVGVWDYLIKSKRTEILKLPRHIERVSDLKICQEAKWLISFWINKGTVGGCNIPSKWMREGTKASSFWGEEICNRIANQVEKIKHWKVELKSYEDIENIRATWFVDPPYISKGTSYRYKNVDYDLLSKYCKNLKGQVIVCENEGANWLPFRTFMNAKSTSGKYRTAISKEVIWTKTDRVNKNELE